MICQALKKANMWAQTNQIRTLNDRYKQNSNKTVIVIKQFYKQQ